MDKERYFQKELDYLIRENEFSLLQQTESTACLLNQRTGKKENVSIHHEVIDAFQETFPYPCVALVYHQSKSDLLYLYTTIDGEKIEMDIHVNREKDPVQFRVDIGVWFEHKYEFDILDLRSLTQEMKINIGEVLQWFEEWVENCSSYRLWFVTNDCTIQGSSSANLLKKLIQKGVRT